MVIKCTLAGSWFTCSLIEEPPQASMNFDAVYEKEKAGVYQGAPCHSAVHLNGLRHLDSAFCFSQKTKDSRKHLPKNGRASYRQETRGI